MSGCCAPAGAAGSSAGGGLARAAGRPRWKMLDIPPGTFRMGTDAVEEGFAEDGEGPARDVTLGAFTIAPYAVTNAQFAQFVRETSYVTQAEREGMSFVFWLQVEPALRASIRQVSRDVPWWLPVEGACWQRPAGPGSTVADRMDHPVVHVSWNDAAAFCAWSGTRLPTEAEWEYAARGGLAGARYPWGDDFEPRGERRCNTWQGEFPARPADGWSPGTVPANAFEPNGWGLYNASGNAWEWCADWFSPDYHRQTPLRDPLFGQPTGRKAMRGGSFLCHDSYCNRYRVAARGSNTPASASSNCGFRLAGPPRA